MPFYAAGAGNDAISMYLLLDEETDRTNAEIKQQIEKNVEEKGYPCDVTVKSVICGLSISGINAVPLETERTAKTISSTNECATMRGMA